MSVIYILIPIAILLTALGIYLFFWAVKTEQFDDLEKQGMSILFDDDNNSSEKRVTSNEKINKFEVKNQTEEQSINKKPTDKDHNNK